MNKKHFLLDAGIILKRSGVYVSSIIILFVFIGVSTSIPPTYRLSSDMIEKLTANIQSDTLLYFFTLENKIFQNQSTVPLEKPRLTSKFLQLGTNIKLDNIQTLLGQELPGFLGYESKIVIRGEGTTFTSLASESSPPLEDVLQKRPAENPVQDSEEEPIDLDEYRETVFIYSTHNRESFLPHLPESTKANEAYHDSVNITKVSDRLRNELSRNGIGAALDQTDFMDILNQKSLNYSKSYEVSRDVVKEAISTKDDLKYVLDIHRDSLPRDKTTKEIDGKEYAKILFVVGADHANFEKNLALATKLHYKIDETYPGLSRGVIQKGGVGTNGIFNQDLLNNSLLLEIGGYENKLEEMYASTEVLAETFSELYWEAEQVTKEEQDNAS